LIAAPEWRRSAERNGREISKKGLGISGIAGVSPAGIQENHILSSYAVLCSLKRRFSNGCCQRDAGAPSGFVLDIGFGTDFKYSTRGLDSDDIGRR